MLACLPCDHAARMNYSMHDMEQIPAVKTLQNVMKRFRNFLTGGKL